ncbi:MAG: metalloregulator ArsR/SmtB family transcription factor [Candidatus Doudnabacteria bacterium]|nr:metalloregulator ArsR/SmtB family transcription factor [Candidatus Doudnabacteria bacterium]
MKDLEKIYKALANRRRLLIIKYLKQHREASVTDIAAYLHLSFRATSRHLAVLRTSEIIDRDQRGLSVFYCLNALHPAIKHCLTLV